LRHPAFLRMTISREQANAVSLMTALSSASFTECMIKRPLSLHGGRLQMLTLARYQLMADDAEWSEYYACKIGLYALLRNLTFAYIQLCGFSSWFRSICL